MGVHGVCLKLPEKTRRFKVHFRLPGRFMSHALLLHLCMSEIVVCKAAYEKARNGKEEGLQKGSWDQGASARDAHWIDRFE